MDLLGKVIGDKCIGKIYGSICDNDKLISRIEVTEYATGSTKWFTVLNEAADYMTLIEGLLQ